MANKIEDLESKLEQAEADVNAYVELKQTMETKKSEEARSHSEALSNLAKLHNEELEKIEAEHNKNLEELKSSHIAELDALKSKLNSDLVALQEIHAAKEAKSNDDMEALRISASSKMSNVEAELAAKLAAKEGELSDRLAESERNLQHAQDEAKSAVEEARRNAQELVASINTKAEAAKKKVAKECREEILDMKAQFEKKEQQLKAAVMDEKVLSEESLKTMNDNAKKQLADLRGELQAKIESSQRLHADERNDMQATIEDLNKHQETLRSELQSVRIQDEQNKNELTVWKEIHDSQGYCNVTLMADDAMQMLEKARYSSERSLSASKELALKYLQRQLEILQDIRVTCIDTYARVSGQMMLFIDEEMAPKISDLSQRAHSRAIAAYDQALPLYDEHVSQKVLPVFNEFVLPVYEEKILPFYNEKVAPATKPIQKEVKAIVEESEKQMKLVHSKAAASVEQIARSLANMMEQHEVDRFLPGWLCKHISELDGTKTVTNLFAFCVFLLCIMCRRLILEIVFLPFRVVWFFSPLRLLFRTRSKPDSKGGELKVNGSSGGRRKKSYKAQIE